MYDKIHYKLKKKKNLKKKRVGHDLVTKEQSKWRWGMRIKSEMTKGLGCRPGVRNWKSCTKHRNKTENFQLRFGFPEHDEGPHLDKGIEHTSFGSSLAWLVTYILDTKNMGTTLLSLKAPINVNSRLCKLILEK